MIQGTQDPQLVHGVEKIVLRWRVHEVELQQVFDIERLQKEDHDREISPLDFRDVVLKQLASIDGIGVESVANAWTRSSCSSRSLVGVGL